MASFILKDRISAANKMRNKLTVPPMPRNTETAQSQSDYRRLTYVGAGRFALGDKVLKMQLDRHFAAPLKSANKESA